MNVKVDLNIFDKRGLAKTVLKCKGNKSCFDSRLKIDYDNIFNKCGELETIVEDLLLLSNVVYSVDKLYCRKEATDGWTRDINITMPVQNKNKFNEVKNLLQKCVTFLTGDIWNFEFEELESSPFKRYNCFKLDDQYNSVSLFSGGLDSLIGVIDWMEENKNERLMMVGHHDHKVPGPKGDQESVLSILNKEYRGQFNTMLVGCGQEPTGMETTYRSRSLVFIALGICAVSSDRCIKKELIIPENGTIAINYPLTPSRRGSCSTRTTHPYFIELISKVITEIGINMCIKNPYEFNTKGESVSKCKNIDALRKSMIKTRSCAKSGHTSSWKFKEAKNCGRCMPCIYRRAALHTIGADIEKYGNDICTGEVNIEENYKSSDDFRACVMFLNNEQSDIQIAKNLASNGSLNTNNIPKYVNLVKRTKKEVSALINDKAIEKVKGWINNKYED